MHPGLHKIPCSRRQRFPKTVPPSIPAQIPTNQSIEEISMIAPHTRRKLRDLSNRLKIFAPGTYCHGIIIGERRALLFSAGIHAAPEVCQTNRQRDNWQTSARHHRRTMDERRGYRFFFTRSGTATRILQIFTPTASKCGNQYRTDWTAFKSSELGTEK